MERITLSKLKAVILKTDLTYEIHNVAAGEAIINKGLYVVNPKYVQAHKDHKSGQLKNSEIFFNESNSAPIPLSKPGRDYKDPSSQYLDDFIYKNALEQTGDPAILGAAASIIQAVKPLLQPANLFKLIFMAAIAYQLLRGVLGL